MPRNIIYHEGSDSLSVITTRPVKEGLRRIAVRDRTSISRIVTLALEAYLRRRGELRQPEEAA